MPNLGENGPVVLDKMIFHYEGHGSSFDTQEAPSWKDGVCQVCLKFSSGSDTLYGWNIGAKPYSINQSSNSE